MLGAGRVILLALVLPSRSSPRGRRRCSLNFSHYMEVILSMLSMKLQRGQIVFKGIQRINGHLQCIILTLRTGLAMDSLYHVIVREELWANAL